MEGVLFNGAVDVVIIDSVPTLTPTFDIEGGMGDAHVGVLPRLVSKGESQVV